MKTTPASKSPNKPAPFVEGLRTSEVVDVALEDISSDETYQFRLNTTTADMCASIQRDGQREPVDLIGGKPYKIVDGFRRVEAIRKLGWTSVKAFVHVRMTSEEAQRLAFLKNVVRKNLSPLDKANAIRLALKRGRTISDLASDFGISDKQVRRYESLLELPDDMQKLVDGGILAMSHAVVLNHHGVRSAEKWASIIAEKKLSRLQLGRELRRTNGAKLAGRRRSIVRIERTRVRLYPCALSTETPREERERAAKLLEHAAVTLRGW